MGMGVFWGEEEEEEELGQVIFKPLANSLPIHLCLGSVSCTSSKTKEALHQFSGKTDSLEGLLYCTFSSVSDEGSLIKQGSILPASIKNIWSVKTIW